MNESCVPGRKCLIRLSDYTDFHWDTLYVFPYTTSESRIAEVLGQPLPGWGEFQDYEVFLLGGRIVHQEGFAVDPERVLPGEVTFPVSSDFVKFSPEQRVAAKLTVESGRKYYQIEPEKQ